MNSLTKILKTSILAFIAFGSIGAQAQTISVTISVKEPTCFSWTNGEATATATGGTSPYSYSWSNGQGGGQTVFGVPAGNYTVTVTDAANRQTTKSFTVGQPPLLVPAVSVIGNSCEAGASYSGSGTGGQTPYSYAWRNLGTNQITSDATLTAPSIGTYHLSVTDARGCTMTKAVNVKPLKVMVIATAATCGGACDGSAEAWVDGGTPPLNYLWSTGATTGIIFPLPGGNYSVTVSDAMGCRTVATGTVFEPEIIKPNLVVTGQCSGAATATVTPTGGRAPLTVLWSTGATTNTVTNLAQGGYFVTVTDVAGCKKDTFFKVSSGLFGLNITKIDASCSGVATGSATATVTGNAIGDHTFRWSNGATSAIISNLSAGIYTVTVSGGGGCSASQSVNIQSISNLVLQTSFTNSVCGGTTGTATVTSISGGTAPYTYRWSNGATTPSVSNLAAGNYTVTTTDASGCTATATFTIQGQGNLIIAVASTPTSCGGSTGMATVVGVTGGTAPFTYRWNNGGTAQTISSLGVGIYYVTVTDAAGCTASRAVEVQATNGLQITVSNTKTDCNGATGTATVTGVTGGSPPYTYKWSTGATTASISGLPIGSYTVTVNDASGCSAVATVVIGANSNIVLATTTTPSVCGGATGTASITSVTGGTAPYIYSWHNGGTTANIVGLAAGSYFVTVTDARGCPRSTAVDVTSVSNIVAITTTSPASCLGTSGGSASVSAVTGGTAPYTFKWSNGAITQTISDLSANNYSVTVTDANLCTTTSTVVVVASSGNIVATTASSPAFCTNKNGTASVSTVMGGTAPYTYKWSTGATTQSITNLSDGSYTVTVTDANGCPSPASTAVVSLFQSTITAIPSITNATCGKINGQISISAIGGTTPYTYKWSDLATSTTLKDRPGLAAGAFAVVITDSNGCTTALSNLRVVDTGSVKAQVALQPQGCTGDSVIMRLTNNSTAQSANITYSWLFTGNRTSTVKSPDVTYGTLEGEARLIARSAEGCLDTLLLRFPLDIIKVDVPDTVLTCVNTAVTITANNLNPNFTPKYLWANGATTAATSVTPTLAGSTKTYVTITNSYGCPPKKDSVVIVAVSKLNTPDVSWKRNCEPFKISFTNTNPYANLWSWVFGGPGNLSAGSTPSNSSFTYLSAGTFTVTLVSSLSCLNPSNISIPVIVSDKNAVIVDAGNDTTVCSNNRITLRGTGNQTNFEWSTSSAFTTIAGTGANLLVTPTAVRNVYYLRSIINGDTCKATDSIVVSNRTINISRATTVDVCKNIPKDFAVTNLNTGDILKVNWSPTSLISGFTNNDSLKPKISAIADGTLIGTYTNQYGCTLRDTITIKSRFTKATATATAKTIYINDALTLNAGPSGTGFKYAWSPIGDVTSPTSASTAATPKVNTTFIVTVTDNFGCTDTAQVALRVLVPHCDEPYIFIPRAFTPNGDGTNDVVFVRGDYLTSVEFVIFNRWGEQVFKTLDKTIGWDGKHNGEPVCPDVYGYYVKGVCKQGEPFFKKGNITVLK